MEFITEELLHYCENFTEPESDLLKKLNRETHLKIGSPRMLSGHLQGRFLSFLSTLQQPTFILEIGTYTGYSALCLAEGLKENGKLITLDPNEETNVFAKKFIDQSPFKNKIELVEGDAQKIIPELKQKFDLVFIDADKKNYPNYYDLIIDKVNSGGLIIVDNVLWSGKVLDEKKDADTQIIHDFNQKVNNDSRVSNVLLPLRDGLMVMRKI
ncbi:O-methyltransferase [Aurantibacillus circumpalustris]|uniref:O-methyltransferase n=1 Tax=Aurantibacillus circumpalustris TaxID=3036359 RepID=UPI00295BA148|nr:O-methyltransferase [Aurantibacillus circumpalustris]